MAHKLLDELVDAGVADRVILKDDEWNSRVKKAARYLTINEQSFLALERWSKLDSGNVRKIKRVVFESPAQMELREFMGKGFERRAIRALAEKRSDAAHLVAMATSEYVRAAKSAWQANLKTDYERLMQDAERATKLDLTSAEAEFRNEKCSNFIQKGQKQKALLELKKALSVESHVNFDVPSDVKTETLLLKEAAEKLP